MLQRSLAAMAVAVILSGPAAAEEDLVTSSQDLTRTTCADLAGQSREERTVSLIFYYGYMAGRSDAVAIDQSAVSGHLNAVRDYCNANPGATIVDAFTAALQPSG
jgi:hypothetical protein